MKQMMKTASYGYDELLPGSREVYYCDQFIDLIVRNEKVPEVLDFSGIDLINDEVLFEINVIRDKLEQVAEVSLKGCHHVSDIGVLQLARAVPSLKKICIDGCSKITEDGLISLVENCSQLQDISAIASGLMFVPQSVKDRNVSLQLEGCPLVAEISSENVEDDYQIFDERKLVILALDMGLHNLTEFLIHGKVAENDAGLMLFRSGVILTGVQEELSVYECHGNASLAATVMSSNAAYIIAVDADKYDNAQLHIMNRINAIRGQVAATRFIVILIHKNSSTSEVQLFGATVSQEIATYFSKQKSAATAQLKEDFSPSLDFLHQNRYARLRIAATEDVEFKLFRLDVDTATVEQHWPRVKKKETGNDSNSVQIEQMDTEDLQNYIAELKKEGEGLLSSYMPHQEKTMEHLNTISKSDISELKSFTKPPKLVYQTLLCVAYFLGEKKPEMYKLFLSDLRLMHRLQNIDKDNISEVAVRKVKHYVDDPEMSIENMRKISKAALSFWVWVEAVYLYCTQFRSNFMQIKAKVMQAEKQYEKKLKEKSEKESQMATGEAERNQLREDLMLLTTRYNLWSQDNVASHLDQIYNEDLEELKQQSSQFLTDSPESQILEAVYLSLGASDYKNISDADVQKLLTTSAVKNYDKELKVSGELTDQLAKYETLITDKPKMVKVSDTLQRLAVWVHSVHQFGLHYAKDIRQVRQQLQLLEGSAQLSEDGMSTGSGVINQAISEVMSRIPRHRFPGKYRESLKKVLVTCRQVGPITQRMHIHEALENDRISYKSLDAVLGKLNELGKILYFPDVGDGLVVSDPGWLMGKLNELIKHRGERIKAHDLGLRPIPPDCCMLQLRQILQDIDKSMILLLEDALVSKGTILQVPLICEIANVPEDLKQGLFFFHDMPDKPFLRTGIKDGYTSSHKHKEQFWPSKSSSEWLENMLVVSVQYEFVTGMPASLMPRVINECLAMGEVMFVNLWGCTIQQGAVEIMVKNSVHASLLYNTIQLEARVSRVGDSNKLSIEYAWSVLSLYLNMVDALLEDYPQLNVRMGVMCPGSCSTQPNTQMFTYNLLHEARAGNQLVCPRCKQNGHLALTDIETFHLTGRSFVSPWHDWTEDAPINSARQDVYRYLVDRKRNKDSIINRCQHCGIYGHACSHQWLQQCQSYPTSMTCLDIAAEKHLIGNIYKPSNTSLGEPEELVLSKLVYWSGFMKVKFTVLKKGTASIGITSRKFNFDPVQTMQGKAKDVTINLEQGEIVYSSGEDCDSTSGKATVVVEEATCVTGDTFAVKFKSFCWHRVAQKESWCQLMELQLLKNECEVGSVKVDPFCAVSLQATGDVEVMIQAPSMPVTSSRNFHSGAALLYKRLVGNTWDVCHVKGIERNSIHLFSPSWKETITVPAHSLSLLPLTAQGGDITISLNGEILPGLLSTRRQLIQNYLNETGSWPISSAAFGEPLHPSVQAMHQSLGLTSIDPFLCSTHHNSPQVLGELDHLPSQVTGFFLHKNTFAVLPDKIDLKPENLTTPCAQIVQDLSSLRLYLLCRGLSPKKYVIPELKGAQNRITDLPRPPAFHFMGRNYSEILAKKDGLLLLERHCDVLLVACHVMILNQDFIIDWRDLLPNLASSASDLQDDQVHRYVREYLYQYRSLLLLFKAQQEMPPKSAENSLDFLTSANPNQLIEGRCDIHNHPADESALQVFSSSSYRHHLSHLNLAKVSLDAHIDSIINDLPSLKVISFYACSKSGFDGLQPFARCAKLVSLYVMDCGVEFLHPDFAALEETLEELILDHNPVSELSEFLMCFKNLKTLSLVNTPVKVLPENFGDLGRLRQLNLMHTMIVELPGSFTNLHNLESFIHGIPWPDLKTGHSITWTEYEMMFATYAPMRVLSTEDKKELFHSVDSNTDMLINEEEKRDFKQLLHEKLPRMRPTGEGDSGFPMALLGCRNLQKLHLLCSGLKSIPNQVKYLTKLHYLHLDQSPDLETVSAELGKAELRELSLEDCPKLHTPPYEVVSQGQRACIAYLERLSQGSVACYRTKLMFVGLGGAGKTTLMRALMSPNYKGVSDKQEAITDGIDICTWSLHRHDHNLTYSVWDFAGQTVYYNTHQFFLSRRAVYLLLWNKRLGYEHAGLEFWLNSLACHCPKAPVFVIGTHADKIANADLPETELATRFPNIVFFSSVSSQTGQGIENLLNKIVQVTLQQPYVGEHVPEAWLSLERSILSCRTSQNLIEWETFCNMGKEKGIYDDEIRQAVQFLHGLGTLQHFDNEQLKNWVVINPQWIVDVMACIVSVHNNVIQDGRLRHQDIDEVWKAYPEHLRRWLLHLTEVFDLTFPLEGQEVNIVPCLLPSIEPEYKLPEKYEDSREFKVIYKFDYFPAGLFNRAQARLYQYSDSSVLWKTGSVMKKNGHHAVVKQIGHSKLAVIVNGPRPENIILFVHEVYEGLIEESFQGVKYEYYLPCRDCLKVSSGFQEGSDPTMFSSKVLRRAVDRKTLFLQCHTFFHTISMSDVQGQMLPESHKDYTVQLENAMRDLGNLEQDLGTDLFFLYCQRDFNEESGNHVDLHSFKDQLERHGYSCNLLANLDTAAVENLSVAMKNSKVILLFMSSEFVADSHCQRLFKFVRDVLQKNLMIVMVGRDRNWKTTDIGMQLAEQVYVDFQKKALYDDKMRELLDKLKKKTKQVKSKPDRDLDVFLSYCWSNSASAVEERQAPDRPGALGFGDPRRMKEILEDQGYSCWLDVDQVGQVGLFEDIADGIKKSKAVIACVSDEYALSPNCQMEFRFAHVTMRKPIVLAVVGTGFNWESTEIGMLSLGYPKINFQARNESAESLLVQSVKEAVLSVGENFKLRPITPDINSQKTQAFKELFELAQRKFLRQIASYTQSLEPYPRLFVADLNTTDTSVENASSGSQGSDPSQMAPGKFSLKFLCEHEGGWHCVGDGFPVNLGGTQLLKVLQYSAPYIGRILAILKHSSMNLEIIETEEGKSLLGILEKQVQLLLDMDMKDVYLSLRNFAIAKDVDLTFGGLKRCLLASGKTLWLCEEHQHLPRATPIDTQFPELATGRSAPEVKVFIDLQNLSKQRDGATLQSQLPTSNVPKSASVRRGVKHPPSAKREREKIPVAIKSSQDDTHDTIRRTSLGRDAAHTKEAPRDDPSATNGNASEVIKVNGASSSQSDSRISSATRTQKSRSSRLNLDLTSQLAATQGNNSQACVIL